MTRTHSSRTFLFEWGLNRLHGNRYQGHELVILAHLPEFWIDDSGNLDWWLCNCLILHRLGPRECGWTNTTCTFQTVQQVFSDALFTGVSNAIEVLLVLFRFLSRYCFANSWNVRMSHMLIASSTIPCEILGADKKRKKRNKSRTSLWNVSLQIREEAELETLSWHCFTTLTNSATTNMQSWSSAKI